MPMHMQDQDMPCYLLGGIVMVVCRFLFISLFLPNRERLGVTGLQPQAKCSQQQAHRNLKHKSKEKAKRLNHGRLKGQRTVAATAG